MYTAFTKWNKNPSKPLKNVLADVYGIGLSTATQILLKEGLQNHYRLGRIGVYLHKQIMQRTTSEDDNQFILTNNLVKDKVRSDIQVLKDIRSYRGVRHLLHLSVRGQRTKTNARTQKSFKPKNSLSQRTSFRNKNPTKKSISQKKITTDSATYTKTSKKRGRGRHALQN